MQDKLELNKLETQQLRKDLAVVQQTSNETVQKATAHEARLDKLSNDDDIRKLSDRVDEAVKTGAAKVTAVGDKIATLKGHLDAGGVVQNEFDKRLTSLEKQME